jgi:hypothetical protein
MATGAAAAVARARREVTSHLMQANAVSAGTAVRFVPERRLQRRVLERFVSGGVVVETTPDTYYLDLPAYDDWRRSLRRRAAILLTGVVAIGAVVSLLA